jgi:ribonuclease HII
MDSDSQKTMTCGVDEAGRGPVIGPMVVSIVCGDPEVFRRIGARDSKALTPQSREKIFMKIIENSSFHLIKVITASELNSLMDRINLNRIEEEAYSELISKSPMECEHYVDSFDVDENRLSLKLSGMTGKRVVCRHKADAIYPAVSAASILSKVTRDREIEKLRKIHGNLGSGYPADPVTRDFILASLRKGIDLTEIVRTHWKTYRDILSESRKTTLF